MQCILLDWNNTCVHKEGLFFLIVVVAHDDDGDCAVGVVEKSQSQKEGLSLVGLVETTLLEAKTTRSVPLSLSLSLIRFLADFDGQTRQRQNRATMFFEPPQEKQAMQDNHEKKPWIHSFWFVSQLSPCHPQRKNPHLPTPTTAVSVRHPKKQARTATAMAVPISPRAHQAPLTPPQRWPRKNKKSCPCNGPFGMYHT